jgi:phenylalanyl-tRNA synthetase alpha chain
VHDAQLGRKTATGSFTDWLVWLKLTPKSSIIPKELKRMSSDLSEQNLKALRQRFTQQLQGVVHQADIDLIKRDWTAKDGIIKELFKGLRDVAPEQKPTVAALLNSLKESVESALEAKERSFRQSALQKQLEEEYLDLSLPEMGPGLGTVHPISIVEERILQILRPFGFESVMGPEIETEYYCFDSLNIPKHHPARDMQDTFYTESGHVLRTHTTSVQARLLQSRALFEGKRLPVKVASFGKVYRNETEDASHTAMFHQFELVWVEKGLTLSNLLGLITHIVKELYGKRRKVQFVPKFYPYTEPSIGPRIDCAICKSAGCPSCGGAGWVTVGGAGMIHRNVLLEFGFNPDEVAGFAFGLGSSRLAGQMYNMPHLRAVYENDLRILKEIV